MRISILVPFFVSGKNKEEIIKEENKRRAIFREWRLTKFEPQIKNLFKDVIIDYLLAFTEQIDRVGQSLVVKYEGATPKGTMVRGKLLSLISKIDYSDIDKNYLILIDGSGKIEFDSVFKVLKALVIGKQVILGCRFKGSGISLRRKKVEIFENFLVSERYKVDLPDAQCGCWGIRVGILKSLSLTANSYEIELDLVTSALESNLSICFVPVKAFFKAGTGFTSKEDLTKLNFLVNKLGLDEYILNALYEKFKKTYGLSLDSNYLNYFKEIPFLKFRKKFDCLKGCKKPCQKVYIYK
ncbi:MAG: hypothetical protein COX91_02210 [Candidatus Nealsonbacteria bacterium CG_4_10_14_0_2_um_filter_39_15]|uniref:Glycosyltransferase 2-like domain-containing protein n=1 Tax=Candidatus Nealsonbacteria bacterium CG_4_10_14_0_2_um_filter_39_15 TaxID=1974681 RepID=A0A2M7UVS6_9BACT|nr:MAG: hypothetical protein COX91_02210 [Candidatus Nealsonbacteria bacterium CG_4_10_14_0_2_um_filter_39_15]